MSTPFLKNPADIWCAGVAAVLALALLFSDTVLNAYMAATGAHPFIAGFCKFAVLATFGECLAQRMVRGCYLPERFGLVPRAVVWGLLGICTTIAFTIFGAGAPQVLALLGLEWAPGALAGPFGVHKLVAAFTVSVTMNTMFAPVLMVAHKIGDLHLAEYGGSAACLVHRPKVGELLRSVDWNVMWNLVLFRSLLFFWIPAHTVTFLLPADFRVLFAAVLGAVLGLILALAGSRRS